MHPRDFAILDVAGIDLIEAAVMVGLVGTVIRRPVVLGRLGIERSRVLGLRRRGRQYGSHRQRGAASKISCIKSHLYPPVLICLLDRVVVATFAVSDVKASSGQASRHRSHGPTELPSSTDGCTPFRRSTNR